MPFVKGKDSRINQRVNPQRRSLKAILLLFVEPYVAGTREAEKYINPDLTKVSVTVNSSPNRLYNNGLESMDIWEEVRRYFSAGLAGANARGTHHMTVEKFYTDKFCLPIDLRSMADHKMHGSGTRLVNRKDGVRLELERDAKGSGDVNCHVFVISDSQMNIMGQQLESVQY